MQSNIFITLMGLGTVAMNAAVVLVLAGLLSPAWRVSTLAFIRRYALLVTFVFATGCLVGSLFIQYVVFLPPCDLCWWQRIFMYPIAFISGVALLKNVRFSDIADYVLVLSIPGALVALYQHLLQMLPAGALIPCDATGACAVRSIFEFGYITMPWMALSTFALFILIAFIARPVRETR
ncbi:MAG: disulfide bond formation protein B [Patescibacteria group bacterium]